MPPPNRPNGERSPLAQPLAGLTRLVLRAPGVVVVGAVLLAVLAVLVTVNGLSFQASRPDLLDPRSESGQRWLAYLAEFGDRDDAVIIVRADDPQKLTAAIDDLASELAKRPERLESIFYRRDLSQLKGKTLFFLPESELKRLEQEVRQAVAHLPKDGQSADPAAALAELNEQLTRVRSASPQSRAALERQYSKIATRVLAELSPDSAPRTPHFALAPDLRLPLAQFTPSYLLADQGRQGFVHVKLKSDPAEFTRDSRAISTLRESITTIHSRHPQVSFGLTGRPVIALDELAASRTDMIWTGLVSLAAVLAIFAAGCGGLRHAALACLMLLLAVAYSFGFVTLAIGHLNAVSSGFAVVLIGLGVGCCVPYVTGYLQLREAGCDEQTALIRTASECGPAVVTGGLATAAAFFLVAITDLIGFRELGIVAGGGILLSVLTTLVVLPSLIFLADHQWPAANLPRLLPIGSWCGLATWYPKLSMLAIAGLTFAAAAGLANLRYDQNLLNLRPQHLESATIERQLTRQPESGPWFAVSLCQSRTELLERKARFAALPSVAKTEEIVSQLPVVTREQERLIVAIHEALDDLPSDLPPGQPINRERLTQEIDRAQRLLAEETPFETPTTALLLQLRRALAAAPAAALAPVKQSPPSTAKEIGRLEELRDLCDPTPPQGNDLPKELLERFVGKSHKHLVKVYPRDNLGDPDKLARFVADLELIDPRVTGHPVQAHYASRQVLPSHFYTGLYIAVAVLLLLWIDFRSLRLALLAMVALGLGLVQLGGLLGWLEIPLTPASMLALPLLVGIGITGSVHLVHEWRRQDGRFRLSDSTTSALLLTATATMASLGTLMLARHQGLSSLAQVLTLGVFTCLGSSLLFFPAVLAWLSRCCAAVPAPEAEIDEAEPVVLRIPPAEEIASPAAAAAESASDDDSSPPQILAFESYVPSESAESAESLPTTSPRRRALPRRTGEVPPAESEPEHNPTPLDHLAQIRQSGR